jgi:hypothetical protein
MPQAPQNIKLQSISQDAISKYQTERERDIFIAKETVLIAIYEQIFGRKPGLDESNVFKVKSRSDEPLTAYVYLNDQENQIFLGIMETTPTSVTFQPSKEFAQ